MFVVVVYYRKHYLLAGPNSIQKHGYVELDGAWNTARASEVTEAMSTTKPLPEKATELTNCANDWCDGPTSDTLPCLDCFDPDRSYDEEAE